MPRRAIPSAWNWTGNSAKHPANPEAQVGPTDDDAAPQRQFRLRNGHREEALIDPGLKYCHLVLDPGLVSLLGYSAFVSTIAKAESWAPRNRDEGNPHGTQDAAEIGIVVVKGPLGKILHQFERRSTVAKPISRIHHSSVSGRRVDQPHLLSMKEAVLEPIGLAVEKYAADRYGGSRLRSRTAQEIADMPPRCRIDIIVDGDDVLDVGFVSDELQRSQQFGGGTEVFGGSVQNDAVSTLHMLWCGRRTPFSVGVGNVDEDGMI